MKVYASNGVPVGYETKTENCVSTAGKVGYTCEADLYVSSNELEDGEEYYFRAFDRKSKLVGNKAYFTFESD